MESQTNQFSYWERSTFIDNADVIIIGSGLVGLSAALHLKKLDPEISRLLWANDGKEANDKANWKLV